MVIEEIKNIKSGKDQLRSFGKGGFIIFGLVGLWLLIHGQAHYSIFLILSATFLFLGLIAPILLKPIYIVMCPLAICIGWVMTKVILTIVFYLVLTPMGIIAKLLCKDLLNIKLDKDKDSYWISREAISFDKSRYENQF